MGFLLGFLSVVAVLSCLLLAFVVLLQEPKGGGIAAALGGSGMEAIGPATGGVNKFTSWMAAIWMTACFAHAVLMGADTAIGSKPADTDKSADTQPGGNPGGGETPEPPK